MSKTSCEIIFENNNTNRVYYSGDTIRGTVIITLQKEKIVKGACVRISTLSLFHELSGLLSNVCC